MKGARATPRLVFGTSVSAGERVLPEEVAVALSFNGTTQAVMMATPEDLEDFGVGFALTEGIARPEEILSVEVETVPRGRDVQIWLKPEAEARLAARRRVMAGPVGCGLCGIDSIDQALRDVPVVPPSAFRLTPSQVRA
ncbi:MAG: formate dehydrogenase accessory sulfurtransferase FdhD, partial [Paracoccaceae bacterium]|nr:formate dehydrogenase accessory sulfurtransferase FdhD [Paracoccaceae bacterium]